MFSNILKLNALACGMLASVFLITTPASAQIYGGNGGKTLLGAGIGTGLGGILGSNLAGTGVQQEGTAIGAVLGGIAGAAIANRNANRSPRLRSSRYGGFMPSYGPGYGSDYRYAKNRRTSVPYSTFGGSYVNTNVGTNYSGTYIQPPFVPPVYWPRIQPNMLRGTQYIQGPNLVQIYTIPYITQQIHYPPVQYIRPAPTHDIRPAPTHGICYGGINKPHVRRGYRITTGSATCR